MMRTRVFGVAAGVLCAAIGSAFGATVSFQGTLGTSCSLSISTTGRLALSADGKTLGSQESGGRTAVVAIVAVGSSTVTVAPPTLSAYPAGFDPGSSQVAVSYNGISGLSGVSSNGYTTSGGSFPVTVLSSLGIDNQVVSSTGFTAGDYTTQTVVTCS